MPTGDVTRALRLAQRAHTELDVHLSDGSDVRGVPHSITTRTLWLLSAADPADPAGVTADVFVLVARISSCSAVAGLAS